MRSGHFDSLVIGAGPNGLVAALYLARAGHKVALIDSAEAAGGLAAVGSDLSLLTDHGHIFPEAVTSLGLEKFGFRWSTKTKSPFVFWQQESSTFHDPLDLDSSYSSKDQNALKSLITKSFTYEKIFETFFLKTKINPYDLSPANVLKNLVPKLLTARLNGGDALSELLRQAPINLADFSAEFADNDSLKASLIWPAMEQIYASPRSPGGSFNLIYHQSLSSGFIEGGTRALITVLRKAISHYNIELIFGQKVCPKHLILGPKKQRIFIPEILDFTSKSLIIACHPASILGKEQRKTPAGHNLITYIEKMRSRALHSILSIEMPTSEKITGIINQAHRIDFIDSLENYEQAFRKAKYDEISPKLPFSIVCHEEINSKKLKITVKVYGTSLGAFKNDCQASEENIFKSIRTTLAEAFSLSAEEIILNDFWQPAKIETKLNLPGGHLYHTEQSIDQMLDRPFHGLKGYETPLKNLFFAGSSCHPGGGLTLAPGYFAAQQVKASY